MKIRSLSCQSQETEQQTLTGVWLAALMVGLHYDVPQQHPSPVEDVPFLQFDRVIVALSGPFRHPSTAAAEIDASSHKEFLAGAQRPRSDQPLAHRIFYNTMKGYVVVLVIKATAECVPRYGHCWLLNRAVHTSLHSALHQADNQTSTTCTVGPHQSLFQ